MEKYRGWWDIHDELPEGWEVDKTQPSTLSSPMPGAVWITNGKSPLKGQKRAVLRIKKQDK